MKKLLSILLALAAFLPAAEAQNIALGQRVSELKVTAGLDGREPAAAPLTYVEFHHPSNPGCQRSLERLQAFSRKYGSKLRIVILTQESEAEAAERLRPYLSPQIAVAVDPEGRAFAAYGVRYIPFGMLLDAKNRVVWMGNSLQLTERIIEDSTSK